VSATNSNNIVLDINDLVVSLGKKPGGLRIIDGVSLQVREGETLCVVGESGSGKSVTSLTVMGLLQKGALTPAGGSIKLVGEELLTASDRRLRDSFRKSARRSKRGVSTRRSSPSRRR